MNWIDVNERLPEVKGTSDPLTSDYVLVVESDGDTFVAQLQFYPIAGYRKTISQYWSENSTSCGCCARNLSPTHWMPLPPIPGEE